MIQFREGERGGGNLTIGIGPKERAFYYLNHKLGVKIIVLLNKKGKKN